MATDLLMHKVNSANVNAYKIECKQRVRVDAELAHALCVENRWKGR